MRNLYRLYNCLNQGLDLPAFPDIWDMQHTDRGHSNGTNQIYSQQHTRITYVSLNIITKPWIFLQFPTGLALAIEKKSRRIEISLYCLARAIESFFTCMTDAGYIRPPKILKRADVVVFSVSTAIIMHCYAQEREVFRSKYLNVLDWVCGVPPPREKT